MLNLRKFVSNKPRIHFIYAERYKYSGSTVMRGEQLSDLAKHVLGTEYRISYGPINHSTKSSILFLTKGAIYTLSPNELKNLKSRNNFLIFDPVDADLADEKAHHADIIVAASRTAFEDYKTSFPDNRVMLVDHHVDPRLRDLNLSKRPVNLRIGYFGELVNTFATPAIEKIVDFVQVDTFRQTSDWITHLPDYNMHYAIRQIRQMDNHKPFLKGFTAAHCGANILIQDSQKEALFWLGKDYPFLLKGEVTEKKVLEKLDHIKESFGSAEWKRAMEVMEDIRKKTSEEAIGRQLQGIFNEINSL